MSFSEEPIVRADVAARNQVLFREVNERVRHMSEGVTLIRSLHEWICECADEKCVERVEMTSAEYEEIREDGARFFVAPGDKHVWPDVEQVVRRNDRFWVIEKSGRASERAKRLNPRSRPLRLRT